MTRGDTKMAISDITTILADFVQSSSLNRVAELADLRIFDPPIIGVATSSDILFEQLKQPENIGSNHLTPHEWLPGSRTVVSYFLPFTAAVRVSNRQQGLPSIEWLYGRIEGQAFIAEMSLMLVELLRKGGHQALAPALDPRFAIIERRSNWSERHVAYIAGLGTLSLNRSLITRVGSAGRLGSVVTDLDLPVTPRYYTKHEENCSYCGACIRRCPPMAINETGKDHARCSAYLDGTMQRFSPRYGCGKCQTAVPCESGIPVKQSAF